MKRHENAMGNLNKLRTSGMCISLPETWVDIHNIYGYPSPLSQLAWCLRCDSRVRIRHDFVFEHILIWNLGIFVAIFDHFFVTFRLTFTVYGHYDLRFLILKTIRSFIKIHFAWVFVKLSDSKIHGIGRELFEIDFEYLHVCDLVLEIVRVIAPR